jgi:antitoxin YefM
MTAITAAKAKNRLSELLSEISISHEPVQIMGKEASGVLISEDDWRSIQETLYLVSVPGMRESIRKGLKTPITKCSKELKW